MAPLWFMFGFGTAAIVWLAVLTTLYLHRKKNQAEKQRIKGYLDLIPDLNQEQRRRVQDIRHVFLPKVESIRRELQKNRNSLAELLFREPADRNKIFAAVRKTIEKQAELEHEVVEHILEEKELLSPAQQEIFYKIIISQFSGGGLGVHDVKSRR